MGVENMNNKRPTDPRDVAVVLSFMSRAANATNEGTDMRRTTASIKGKNVAATLSKRTPRRARQCVTPGCCMAAVRGQYCDAHRPRPDDPPRAA